VEVGKDRAVAINVLDGDGAISRGCPRFAVWMSASLATLICWNERDFDVVVIIIGVDGYVSLQAKACAWPIEQGWQSKREALGGIAAERRADGFDEHPSICEV
jgi:hypothetical protein